MAPAEQIELLLKPLLGRHSPCRRLGTGVWHLRQPGLRSRLFWPMRNQQSIVAQSRTAIFNIMTSAIPNLYMCHVETPTDYEVPGVWKESGHLTWQVPSDFDTNDVNTRSWLHLGAWTLYIAPDPIHDRRVPLARMSPEKTLEWFDQRNIRAMVMSFYDDIEWRIAATSQP